jgi:uncharacterized protein
MSAAHPNAGIARRMWDAASRGDAETLLRLYAADIVWHGYGSHPLSGEVKGAEAVLDLLARAGEDVDDLRSDALDILASERGAVIHYRLTAERGPKRLNTEVLMLLRIEGDRVTRVNVVPWDQASHDAFWQVE